MTAYPSSLQREAARKRAVDTVCAVLDRGLGWAPEQLADEILGALIASDDHWHPGPRRDQRPPAIGPRAAPTPEFTRAADELARRNAAAAAAAREDETQ